VELMQACIDGRLPELRAEWHDGASCAVVLAARGYPGATASGEKIIGLDDLEEGVMAFHGGTRLLQATPRQGGWLRRTVQGTAPQQTGIVADGGRIVTLVATGSSVAEARARAYANVDRIKFDGMQYRHDLGAVDPTLEEVWSDFTSQDSPSARTGEAPTPPPTARNAESAQSTSAAAISETTDTHPRADPAAETTAAVKPMVAVLMGSESDRPIMDETAKALESLAIPSETHVMSAHRTPERVRAFARGAEARGIRVVIAGAGGAAHLPGVIAAQTTLPVIGVPIAGSSLMGLDSLLSIVQMPGGVPVATVAVGTGGARNAAYLAAAIIGIGDPEVRTRYKQFRKDQSGGELEL
jgi:5-(carboxyamino)imidazole ribonucleotide mutase